MRILAAGGMVLLIGATTMGEARAQPAASPPVAAASEQDVEVTDALVREVQFMLLRVGIDPGPIDGIPSRLTNGALRRYEEKRNLPPVMLDIGQRLPGSLLAALREEAARAVLGVPAAPAAAAAAGPNAAAPPKPAEPAPDRFAACTFNPADFRIGGRDYTPVTLLQEAFNGSADRAVKELKKRLDEARQIAQQVGAAATKEVQRQSHVLDYYECRLTIEKKTGGK